jgi:very-short-patch-repair endonuclease
MRTSIQRARSLRKRATPSEKIVWLWLRHRYLADVKFRRQHPFGPYVLDFYSPALRLCIELDGRVHELKHSSDATRDAFLDRCGVRVLRLPNDFIRDQPDGAWEAIVAAVIAAGGPSPHAAS